MLEYPCRTRSSGDDIAASASGGAPLGVNQLDQIQAIEARAGLRQLEAESVDCILTSPPYWATRDYSIGPADWKDGTSAVLGLEPDLCAYVEHLVEVFDEARRVLKHAGTLWVNLGDVYAGRDRGSVLRALRREEPDVATHTRRSAEKSLCMIPERFALRMLERGWILRNRISWAKPNRLPSSVSDRFTCSWEYLFLFTKSKRYYFDLDAVRVPYATPPSRRDGHGVLNLRRADQRGPVNAGRPVRERNVDVYRHGGRNPGDCWLIPTVPSRSGHPAAFPQELCVRPILAGCPRGGLVVDPFAGSGTTCLVARKLGRRFLGFDANPTYVEQARRRLSSVAGVTS